jgi:hypothetical protein
MPGNPTWIVCRRWGTTRRLAAGQRQRDLPLPTRQQPQPTGKIDPAGRDLSRCGSSVFDDDFLPTVLVVVEAIEPLDLEALVVRTRPSGRRRD